MRKWVARVLLVLLMLPPCGIVAWFNPPAVLLDVAVSLGMILAMATVIGGWAIAVLWAWENLA